jgi:hypothetical protein
MASNLNSEFNYRYQVIGNTPWEKIKTLQGFLVGRKRAAVLEEVAALKHQAKIEEIKHLKTVPALPHILLNLQAELIEAESFLDDQKHAFELNRKEIKILEKLMTELYLEVEPTRLKHEDGTRRISIEGYRTEGNWILTDYGDVVLHVFSPEGRALYDLERLWADAPRIEWQKLISAIPADAAPVL